MKTIKAQNMGKAKVVPINVTPLKTEKKAVVSQPQTKEARPVDSAGITHEMIAKRAWSIWKASGCKPGQDEKNWKQAEMELKRERKQS